MPVLQRRHCFGVFLMGMGILMMEIVLTRIFSVTMWYYFGFLAISVALLGLSASGVVVYVFPGMVRGDRLDGALAGAAALFGLGSVAACLFHFNVTFVSVQFGQLDFLLRALAHVFVLTVPFFFAGLCISWLFTMFHRDVPRIYFFDLAGSGMGCLILIGLMHVLSGPAIVFVVAALAALAAIVFQGRPIRWPYVGLFLGLVLAAAGNDRLGLLHITTIKSFQPGQFQEREDHVVHEEWSPISRITVTGPAGSSGPRVYRIWNDAAAPTVVNPYLGSPEAMVRHVRWPHKLAVHMVQGRCLIIGSGGGIDIWGALTTGQTEVVAVELNPVTVGLMRGKLAEFAGHVYDQPKVEFHIGEGRNFIQRTAEPYDLIELTMVDSWVGSTAGAFMFNENNLYTVEAIRSYWQHLTEKGIISITRYYPFHESLRLASCISAALIEEGIDRPQEHMIVVRRERYRSRYNTATVLAFRQPVSPEQSAHARQLVERFGGRVIYAPHLPEQALASEEEDRNIRGLLEPELRGTTRQAFLDAFPADISPTVDNRPFFFYTQRPGIELSIDPKVHRARAMALPVLYGLFVVLFFLSILCLFLPLFWFRKRSGSSYMPPLSLLLYFSCLGLGFMLVEIPLIQKFVLFLGHPTYSFTLVLTSLLVFSGIGSYLSNSLPLDRSSRSLSILLGLLVILLLGYLGFLDLVLHVLLGQSLWVRVLATLGLLAPLGLLMGIPFPSGIRLVANRAAEIIPWVWAINGAFSVLTTVLALLVAINFGFQATLSLGVVAYGLGLLCVLLIRNPRKT